MWKAPNVAPLPLWKSCAVRCGLYRIHMYNAIISICSHVRMNMKFDHVQFLFSSFIIILFLLLLLLHYIFASYFVSILIFCFSFSQYYISVFSSSHFKSRCLLPDVVFSCLALCLVFSFSFSSLVWYAQVKDMIANPSVCFGILVTTYVVVVVASPHKGERMPVLMWWKERTIRCVVVVVVADVGKIITNR